MASKKKTDDPIMKALSEPFPEDVVEKREGSWDPKTQSKQQYSYIPSSEVINRLNQVVGLYWSASEEETVMTHDTILKRVRITIYDKETGKEFYREQWGSHAFIVKGKPRDPGDCAKSAYSKAFTKAASLFGIGLYLWGVDPGEGEVDVIPDGVVAQGTGAQQFQQPPQQQAMQQPPQRQPNVVTVNPGQHNQVPQGNSGPGLPPPMMNNPNLPSGPFPNKPVGPPQPVQPPPPMGNPNAQVQQPPQQQPVPPPTVGHTSGPGTTAQAQVTLQGEPNGNGQPVQGHQLNSIKGLAQPYGIDPLSVVMEALGSAAQGVYALEQITYDQANEVLRYMRDKYPPVYNSNNNLMGGS
jgi:hypothetical protein